MNASPLNIIVLLSFYTFSFSFSFTPKTADHRLGRTQLYALPATEFVMWSFNSRKISLCFSETGWSVFMLSKEEIIGRSYWNKFLRCILMNVIELYDTLALQVLFFLLHRTDSICSLSIWILFCAPFKIEKTFQILQLGVQLSLMWERKEVQRSNKNNPQCKCTNQKSKICHIDFLPLCTAESFCHDSHLYSRIL